MEKILKVLTVENKDIRKADWNNKEVHNMSFYTLFPLLPLPKFFPLDEKEPMCSITQLVEEGVTPQYSFEIDLSF